MALDLDEVPLGLGHEPLTVFNKVSGNWHSIMRVCLLPPPLPRMPPNVCPGCDPMSGSLLESGQVCRVPVAQLLEEHLLHKTWTALDSGGWGFLVLNVDCSSLREKKKDLLRMPLVAMVSASH